MKKMMHIGLCPGDIAETVILPGSPERSRAIAARLERVEEKAYNREYRTFTGYLDGFPVSVCSTGTGGPSVAIAVEELYQLGAKTLIRAGTCLALQDSVHRGDLILPTGAVRMEGVSYHYLPKEFPAVADPDLVESLEASLQSKGIDTHIGVCVTRSSYYTPVDVLTRPVRGTLSSAWSAYREGGAVCTDMESAVLFITGGCLGVRTAALLISVSEGSPSLESLEDAPQDCEERLVGAVLEGIRSIAHES